jgi:hypothetical protein
VLLGCGVGGGEVLGDGEGAVADGVDISLAQQGRPARVADRLGVLLLVLHRGQHVDEGVGRQHRDLQVAGRRRGRAHPAQAVGVGLDVRGAGEPAEIDAYPTPPNLRPLIHQRYRHREPAKMNAEAGRLPSDRHGLGCGG